jgi:hypothetical protein
VILQKLAHPLSKSQQFFVHLGNFFESQKSFFVILSINSLRKLQPLIQGPQKLSQIKEREKFQIFRETENQCE